MRFWRPTLEQSIDDACTIVMAAVTALSPVALIVAVILVLAGCTYPTYYRGDQEVTMQDQMACGRWIAGELNPLDLMFRTNVMYEAADRCLRSKGYVCDDSKADAGVCPGSVKR